MKDSRELVCNVCARKIKMKNGLLMEDVFEGEKEWGYFSRKDMVKHSFTVCEECYDKWIAGFAIPPEENEVTEL